MYFTNDPLKDFERYEAEQEENAQKLPLCEICGERIHDEYGYCVDGYWYHEECFEKEYKKEITLD